MKYLFIFSVVFLFFTNTVAAQIATVKGKAEKMPNELVRVIIFSDHFSHIEKTLASTYTDDSGQFELEIDIETTSYAFLALGLKKGEFYLKPGGEYTFQIPFDNETERTSVFDELPLLFTLDAKDDSLNDYLWNFNNNYNSFLLENGSHIYRSKDKSLISEFVLDMNEKYGDYPDEFFQGYVKYTIASLELLSKKKNDKQIISEYFADNPILYSNIQYVDFFSEFFKNFYGSTSLFSYSELVDAINSGRGFVIVDRLIARETTLSDSPLIRELIGVILTSRKYYNPEIRKKNVLALLNEIKRNSKSADNGLIAGNTILKLKNLAYGTQAPRFSLTDQNGEIATLPQFRGRFILLYFVRSNCKPCLYYFQNLEQIRKEFNGKLDIVVISDDKGFAETVSYAQKRAYDWAVLNLGKDILLLENYGIRTYPSLILINPSGTIASATAPMPEEGLDLYIKRYMLRYEKNNPQPKED